MVYATLLYLLIAAFVIFVWSPPEILRMIILLVLILLYLLTSKRFNRRE
ncbi:hypothetical protein P7D85_20125 [Enterococcus hulanensis]|uniref:Uncharacterized protein n=1 Tax=Enterococcus hulanensis TaxID=2559929 RepID=A0ABU3F7C2_9ENTE|nr:hypothetical protein [Enterococcus hulanensis]MDT2602071.1 hypothetical protein [Enterococcus hulanensis]MDT2608366.1 hypothetical protein [Enterococcus hulanensis]MDT2615661.1 hypothetical protein [Enterococcus hulanensis]MDT2630143.1 hypothetical protein [Enterococcus hulanensis]MDT2654733.1 hypothetical protein [Enterococcus hulanensis]